MTDEKPPVEKAVDLLVYAPVGMALYVRDMMPSMLGIFVARGKREVQSHRMPPPPPVTPPPIPDEVKRRIDESVGLARVVAEGGFGVAREVAGSGIGVARDMAGTALQGFLSLRNGEAGSPAAPTPAAAPPAPAPPAPAPPAPAPPAPAPPAPAPPAPTPPAPAPPASGPPPAAPEPTATPSPPDASWSAPAPSSESLPIPDYDELSASQVVERLEGLDAESLEAIRRYETDHRGRNTILGKISQLT